MLKPFYFLFSFVMKEEKNCAFYYFINIIFDVPLNDDKKALY